MLRQQDCLNHELVIQPQSGETPEDNELFISASTFSITSACNRWSHLTTERQAYTRSVVLPSVVSIPAGWSNGGEHSDPQIHAGISNVPVLSCSWSSLSPRSATFVMLSLIMPTVSSICCWIAAVLELPAAGAEGFAAEPPRGRYGSYGSDLHTA